MHMCEAGKGIWVRVRAGGSKPLPELEHGPRQGRFLEGPALRPPAPGLLQRVFSIPPHPTPHHHPPPSISWHPIGCQLRTRIIPVDVKPDHGITFSSLSPPPSELVEVSSSVPVALVIKKGRIHTDLTFIPARDGI